MSRSRDVRSILSAAAARLRLPPLATSTSRTRSRLNALTASCSGSSRGVIHRFPSREDGCGVRLTSYARDVPDIGGWIDDLTTLYGWPDSGHQPAGTCVPRM